MANLIQYFKNNWWPRMTTYTDLVEITDITLYGIFGFFQKDMGLIVTYDVTNTN